jgi:hypothetical protein
MSIILPISAAPSSALGLIFYPEDEDKKLLRKVRFTRLHDATFQKIILFTVNAVRTLKHKIL